MVQGIINDIPTNEELINRIITDATEIIQNRLANMLTATSSVS